MAPSISQGWSFMLLIHPVIHQFLLNSFCAPGTVLSTGVTEVSKTKISALMEHSFQGKREKINK